MTKKRGWGMSCVMYGFGFSFGYSVPASARVTLDADGRVLVEVGSVDMGQGADTVAARIVCHELKIGPARVEVHSGDSALPLIGASCASRTTYAAGNAVHLATCDLRSKLLAHASSALNAAAAELELGGGCVLHRGDVGTGISLAELAAEFGGGQIVGEGTFYEPPTTDLNDEDGQCDPFYGRAYACHVAEVEVDTDTGEVEVLRLVAAHDVGTAINRLSVEGQIIGGATMGLGYALMEEIAYDRKGVLLSDSFTTYRIPTAVDVPAIEPVIVEEPLPTGPYGARGVGEPPTIAATAAVMNAIQDAIGVSLTSLPATPERILAALEQSRCRQ